MCCPGPIACDFFCRVIHVCVCCHIYLTIPITQSAIFTPQANLRLDFAVQSRDLPSNITIANSFSDPPTRRTDSFKAPPIGTPPTQLAIIGQFLFPPLHRNVRSTASAPPNLCFSFIFVILQDLFLWVLIPIPEQNHFLH